MRDWQEAIDFFAEIPAEAIDLQHFGRTPVPGQHWTMGMKPWANEGMELPSGKLT